MFTRGVNGHPGHRRFVGTTFLAAPAAAPAAGLGLAITDGCVIDGVGVQHDAAAAALGTVGGKRLDQTGAEFLAGELHQTQRRHL